MKGKIQTIQKTKTVPYAQIKNAGFVQDGKNCRTEEGKKNPFSIEDKSKTVRKSRDVFQPPPICCLYKSRQKVEKPRKIADNRSDISNDNPLEDMAIFEQKRSNIK